MSEDKKLVLKRNAAECRLCGDLIESKTQEEFVKCGCGEIFVEGGLSNLRRGGRNIMNLIDKCEWMEVYR
jgi:hypothetical protein